MKYIPLTDVDGASGKDIIEAVLRHPGDKGAVLDQMRKRSRIWDALDSNTDPCGLTLEDADAAILIGLLQTFPFGTASRDLVKFCTAIVEAKAPTAPMLPLMTNGAGREATSAKNWPDALPGSLHGH